MLGTIYLLHFAQPISPAHTCQHYLGWCLDLDTRMAAHRAGRGSRLTQVAVERGIDFVIAQTWPGDRTLERRLKHRKEGPRLCPLCFPMTHRRVTINVEQLALPFPADTADDPFPAPPSITMDRYEIIVSRSWQARRAAPALAEEWDAGLL